MSPTFEVSACGRQPRSVDSFKSRVAGFPGVRNIKFLVCDYFCMFLRLCIIARLPLGARGTDPLVHLGEEAPRGARGTDPLVYFPRSFRKQKRDRGSDQAAVPLSPSIPFLFHFHAGFAHGPVCLTPADPQEAAVSVPCSLLTSRSYSIHIDGCGTGHLKALSVTLRSYTSPHR